MVEGWRRGPLRLTRERDFDGLDGPEEWEVDGGAFGWVRPACEGLDQLG